jgi:hypothetical protein
MGMWQTVALFTVNDTELSAYEFQDYLFILPPTATYVWPNSIDGMPCNARKRA